MQKVKFILKKIKIIEIKLLGGLVRTAWPHPQEADGVVQPIILFIGTREDLHHLAEAECTRPSSMMPMVDANRAEVAILRNIVEYT